MRALGRVPALVPLLVLLALAALLAPPVLAADPIDDPAGDSTLGRGPDVVAVHARVVDGTLVVDVTFASDPALAVDPGGGWTDELSVTGTTTRADGRPGTHFVLGLVAGADPAAPVPFASVATPEGGWRYLEPGAVQAVVSGRTLALTIPVDRLGGPTEIRVAVKAVRDGTRDSIDRAPASGWILAAGPALPTMGLDAGPLLRAVAAGLAVLVAAVLGYAAGRVATGGEHPRGVLHG